MADTDLDALIQRHAEAVINMHGLDVHSSYFKDAQRECHAAEAALRARLAPTTHADDEALIDNIRDGLSYDTYNYRGQIRRYADDLAALSRSLAELRARAEAAEKALAECRNKTIEDACAALKAKQAMLIDVGCDGPVVNAFSSAMGVIRALKTKEPT